MTLTLDLPDDLVRQLEEQAQSLNTTVESLAELKLRAPVPVSSATQNLPDEDFLKIAQNVINDNRELLERLAK